jgi:hypothetical protein
METAGHRGGPIVGQEGQDTLRAGVVEHTQGHRDGEPRVVDQERVEEGALGGEEEAGEQIGLIVEGEVDVVEVDEDASGEAGEDFQNDSVDFAAWADCVSGIDEEKITGRKVNQGIDLNLLGGFRDQLDESFSRDPSQVSGRKRVDAADLGRVAGFFGREEDHCGGDTAADLDNDGRPLSGDEGIEEVGLNGAESGFTILAACQWVNRFTLEALDDWRWATTGEELQLGVDGGTLDADHGGGLFPVVRVLEVADVGNRRVEVPREDVPAYPLSDEKCPMEPRLEGVAECARE